MEILTPNALWAEQNPSAEQIDVTVVSEKQIDDITVKKVYFTGRSFASGRKSRVYAIVCVPQKRDKRAMFVVDDYKKPVSESNLEAMAKNGFVVMAIDYAGRQPKGLGTIYPPELEHCNADIAEGLFYVGDSVKDNKLFEYAFNSMRAITYLLGEEHASSVSVVTVGRGSYVGAIVLGVDKRVERGVVVFGALHRNYKSDYTKPESDENLSVRLEEEDRAQAWTMGLAPQSYVLQITSPVYVINSANSAHVDIAEVDKIYYRVNDDSRFLILPLTLDYLPQAYAESVVRWCKGETVSEDYDLSSFIDDEGNSCVKVKTDNELEKTSVWYCVAPKNRARHWVKADLTAGSDGYVAKLDVYESDCDVAAFALFDGKVAISSSLLEVKVRNAKRTCIPGNVVFSGDSGKTLIPLTSNNSCWWGKELYGREAKGYLGIVGMEGRRFATFAIHDPSVRASSSFTISFDVCCKIKQKMTVKVICDYGKQNVTYATTVSLIGDGKWQRVTVDTHSLHRVDDGRQMSEEEIADCLEISADEKIIVNNILMV